MIAYMEEMRANRVARERAALIVSRKQFALEALQAYKNKHHMPQTQPLPELGDFCAMDIVIQVLELPDEVDVATGHFNGVMEVMPELILEWQKKVDVMLAERLAHKSTPSWHHDLNPPLQDAPPSDEDLARLKLATTVFYCGDCVLDHGGNGYLFGFGDEYIPKLKAPLFYPTVIGHRCTTRHSTWWFERFSEGDIEVLSGERVGLISGERIMRILETKEERNNWRGTGLHLNDRASAVIRNILRAAGKDAEVTTTDEMDSENPHFQCLACLGSARIIDQTPRPTIFGWRDAVGPSLAAVGCI